jgi:transmembrane sensor
MKNSMDNLIYRAWKRVVSPSEQETLLAWRRASEANETHYRQTVQLLELGEAALKADVPPRPSVDAVKRRAAVLAADRWGAEGQGRARFMVATLALAAAAIVAFVVLRRPVGDAGPGGREFATGTSETATVKLADGTVVRLAPRSRLRVITASGDREVHLEGRAYFAVAKDAARRPFRVVTGAGVAQDLGTRFDLQARGRDLRLVVVEGRVALGEEERRVEVGAGEMSRMSSGVASQPTGANVDSIAAWVGRFLVFQSTPVSEVVKELERAYSVRIEVGDSLVARQTVSGTFSDRPFAEVFASVCEVLQVSCSTRGATAKLGP